MERDHDAPVAYQMAAATPRGSRMLYLFGVPEQGVDFQQILLDLSRSID